MCIYTVHLYTANKIHTGCREMMCAVRKEAYRCARKNSKYTFGREFSSASDCVFCISITLPLEFLWLKNQIQLKNRLFQKIFIFRNPSWLHPGMIKIISASSDHNYKPTTAVFLSPISYNIKSKNCKK